MLLMSMSSQTLVGQGDGCRCWRAVGDVHVVVRRGHPVGVLRAFAVGRCVVHCSVHLLRALCCDLSRLCVCRNLDAPCGCSSVGCSRVPAEWVGAGDIRPLPLRASCPYTDAWVPVLSIESKSNKASIYMAIARSKPTDDRMGERSDSCSSMKMWTRWDRQHQDEPRTPRCRGPTSLSARPGVRRAGSHARAGHALPAF
jgi:hypothetical protein